jgi:hypothetical protein
MSAYWVLAFATLVGTLVSISIQYSVLRERQFETLFGLAIGTIVLVALFAFVLTPFAMRGRLKEYSFTKAVIFMESCALISIIMLTIGLISVWRYREALLAH